MEKFIEEAEKVSFDREIGEAYDKEWALKDEEYNEGRMEGRIEGKKEGKIEGKMDAKIEIVKKMMEKEMNIKTISEIVDLSEEKIEKIMNKSS